MFKIILFFLIVFGICFYGIKSFRDLTGKDKWALTKLVIYSTICAVLAIVFLALIVILF
jgi:heme/copper-type cytochrome/quinol oxidase subunit 2